MGTKLFGSIGHSFIGNTPWWGIHLICSNLVDITSIKSYHYNSTLTTILISFSGHHYHTNDERDISCSYFDIHLWIYEYLLSLVSK